jgi:hypothetical protein
MNPGIATSKDSYRHTHYGYTGQSQNLSPDAMTRRERQDDNHRNDENDHIGLDPRHGQSLDRATPPGGHSRALAQPMLLTGLLNARPARRGIRS